MPYNQESYPEYDQLLADGKLDVVVLFGKVDAGPVDQDSNWRNVDKLARWLVEAGFGETQADIGRRFVRTVDDLTETVDIYGPDVFNHVVDYDNLVEPRNRLGIQARQTFPTQPVLPHGSDRHLEPSSRRPFRRRRRHPEPLGPRGSHPIEKKRPTVASPPRWRNASPSALCLPDCDRHFTGGTA